MKNPKQYLSEIITTIEKMAGEQKKRFRIEGVADEAAEGLYHQRLTIGDTYFLLCVNCVTESWKLRNVKDGDISTCFEDVRFDIKWS